MDERRELPIEPVPTAVALAYEHGDLAPKVLAKGRGLIADEIIRRAREAGIYVHESRELVGLLIQVDLDSHIPPQLYRAVAELLAWIYRVERQPNMVAVNPNQSNHSIYTE